MNVEETFEDSYTRVLQRTLEGKEFFDVFYDIFLAASPVVAEKFRYTDMEQQKKMLEKSFYKLLIFYATNSADDYLQRIARKHSKLGLDIQPALYDLWLESLIQAVQRVDPEFDDDIELAWRLVMAPGITFMKFKYDH